MKEICYIETGNRHGQILVFEKKRQARDWMRRATRLTDEEIENEIHVATPNWQAHFDIFPTIA